MWHAVVRVHFHTDLCDAGTRRPSSVRVAVGRMAQILRRWSVQGGTCMYVALHSLKPGCMATSTYYVGATGSQNQGAGGSQ